MDENKRDDIQPEESVEEITATETVAEENAPAQTDANELKQELEELRDMFQQELDKATEEAENPQELIQELEEITAENDADEIDAEPARLCECCGENPCTTEYGEDYPYCEECRNAMKKYPLRWSGIVTAIIMAIVFVATAYVGTGYAEDFMSVADAAAYYDTGKLMTALNSYYGYLSSANTEKISMKAVKDAIEGFVKTGYIADAVDLVNRVYSENQLKLPWNKKYAALAEKSESLTESYRMITDIITPVLNKKDYDYDKVMADLDALYEKTDEEGNPVNVNAVFVEYYRYVVMSVSEKSTDELLAQLKKTAEKDTDGSLEWSYLANYCALAAKSGDLELTEKLFNQMIDTSSEDTNAYVAMASYYRYTETPDPDKMLEICEEAKKYAATGDLSYMPTMAVAYLLKGEGAVALETMTECLSNGGYTVQTCNLYALCALYNGDKEIYKDMKDMLEKSGYSISDSVEQYKKGKLEIKDILTDKEGDI